VGGWFSSPSMPGCALLLPREHERPEPAWDISGAARPVCHRELSLGASCLSDRMITFFPRLLPGPGGSRPQPSDKA
jgi:hypothetical protein